jgi:hypothetical protein
VLVAVGVQVAGGERGVGLDVVAELDDLDLQAVFFGDLLDLLKDLRVRAGGDADLERLVLREHGGRQGGGQRECEAWMRVRLFMVFPF